MYQKSQESALFKASKELIDQQSIDIHRIEELRDVLRYHEWRYSDL